MFGPTPQAITRPEVSAVAAKVVLQIIFAKNEIICNKIITVVLHSYLNMYLQLQTNCACICSCTYILVLPSFLIIICGFFAVRAVVAGVDGSSLSVPS